MATVSAEFTADFSQFTRAAEGAQKVMDKTVTSTNQWSTAIGKADSILSQSGVNLSNEAKALDEIANMAGKTVTEVGLLGTALAAAGVAMAAWTIGTKIGEMTGWTDAIAKGTAALWGYGDAVAQASGAQTDTINRAIALGADKTIGYAAAIAFLTQKHKERLAGVKDNATADEKLKEAMVELNSAGGTLQGTLDTMNGATVEAVKHYLDMGVSQSALQTAYGLTATQVKAIAESVKAADAADKAWLEGMKAAAAEADAFAEILRNLATDAQEKTAAADERATRALTEKTDAIAKSIQAEAAARASLEQSVVSTDKLTAAWVTMNTKLAELEKTKQGDITTTARQQVIYKEYTDTLLEDAKAADEETKAFWKARDALKAKTEQTKEATKQTGVYMNQLHMLIDDPKIAGFFGFDPKGAVANTLWGGGQAGITPEMAAAMAAGQFINTAGVGAVHNTFNVNGTAQDVARTIANQIMSTMKSGGKMASS